MRRILLVDDNPALLAAVGQVLREAGYEVTSTNSGADSLCLVEKSAPDLIILDVQMQCPDGYAVLRALPAGHAPVVLMSGGDIDETRFDCSRVARILPKPFEMVPFLALVREVLTGSPLSETWDEAEEQRKRTTERYLRGKARDEAKEQAK